MVDTLPPTGRPLRHERVPRPDIYVGGKPAFVFNRGAVQVSGKDAMIQNISVAQDMVRFVENLFGPRKLIKLIISQEGRTTLTFVTSDLGKILRKVKLEHPVAQLMAGAAMATSRTVGDGSVSTILLSGKILEECGKLLRRGIHPSILGDGLLAAYRRALESVDKRAFTQEGGISQILKVGVEASLTGRLPDEDMDHVANLVLRAIEAVGVENLKRLPSKELVNVKKIVGGSLRESFTLDGIAMYREFMHLSMPRKVNGARIAMVRKELRLPDKKLTRYYSYRFEFNTVEDFREFENSKMRYLKDLTDTVLGSGANVVFVEKGVDDYVIEYLGRKGILLVRRFPPPEVDRVARSTGASPVATPSDLTPDCLGWAEEIEHKKISGQPWLLIGGCRNPGTVDIVLRGVSKYFLDYVEDMIYSSISVCRTLIEDPRVVWGGGALEQAIALELRDFANEFPDKRQVVIRAVAEAFESLPALLGRSAGLDELDVITNLRAQHGNGISSMGVDVAGCCEADMRKTGVVDSWAVKRQAIKGAFEASVSVVRVDEYIKSRRLSPPERHYVERTEKTKESEDV